MERESEKKKGNEITCNIRTYQIPHLWPLWIGCGYTCFARCCARLSKWQKIAFSSRFHSLLARPEDTLIFIQKTLMVFGPTGGTLVNPSMLKMIVILEYLRRRKGKKKRKNRESSLIWSVPLKCQWMSLNIDLSGIACLLACLPPCLVCGKLHDTN